MTKEQLKSALISLVLGVITIALSSLLEGLIKILKEWMIQSAGGGVASITYLYRNFRV
jgi:hypothetical protein